MVTHRVYYMRSKSFTVKKVGRATLYETRINEHLKKFVNRENFSEKGEFFDKFLEFFFALMLRKYVTSRFYSLYEYFWINSKKIKHDQ